MEHDPGTPPDNADDWSNEQWIEWLKATDAAESAEGEPTSEPRPYPATRTTGGQLLGNAMIGLAQALYGRTEEKPAIVVESDEPESDQEFELHLDYEHPDRSYVIHRPGERETPAPE